MSVHASFELYDEFLEFRKKFIQDALEVATYKDDRGNESVRPVVLIKSRAELKKISKAINEWKDYVERLVEMDPVRFDAKATIFNPVPQLFIDPVFASVRTSNATSTRKMPKSNVLRRMDNLLTHERLSAELSGDWSRASKIAEEIEFMKQDDEEFYRVRTDGYTDVCLHIKVKKNAESIKIRVPYSGVFIFSSNKNFIVDPPEGSRQEKGRCDTLLKKGVLPIPCSLPIKGKIYRESEIQAAKKRPVRATNEDTK